MILEGLAIMAIIAVPIMMKKVILL